MLDHTTTYYAFTTQMTKASLTKISSERETIVGFKKYKYYCKELPFTNALVLAVTN